MKKGLNGLSEAELAAIQMRQRAEMLMDSPDVGVDFASLSKKATPPKTVVKPADEDGEEVVVISETSLSTDRPLSPPVYQELPGRPVFESEPEDPFYQKKDWAAGVVEGFLDCLSCCGLFNGLCNKKPSESATVTPAPKQEVMIDLR